jgi:hypothetical protein
MKGSIDNSKDEPTAVNVQYITRRALRRCRKDMSKTMMGSYVNSVSESRKLQAN